MKRGRQPRCGSGPLACALNYGCGAPLTAEDRIRPIDRQPYRTPMPVGMMHRQREAVVIGDLGGAGKIVESLLSAVSGAIGRLYQPNAIRKEGIATADVEAYRIERIALAQAQAALIRGDADAPSASDPNGPTISPQSMAPRLPAPSGKERAADRLLHVEVKRQDNLENVVGEGLAYAQTAEAEGSAGRPIDDDWMFAFIDYAQNVSNVDIRRLWAKILSNQATDGNPTISRATLDAMRLLEPSGAALFERIVRIYMLTGMIMAVHETENLAFNPDAIETLNLIDIGFLRRIEVKEASIAHHRGVWLFFNPKKLNGEGIHRTRIRRKDINQLDHYEDVEKEIRLDRCDLTSRGLELATILFSGFQDIMSGKRALDAAEIGVTSGGLADDLQDEWARAISARNVVLFDAEMRFETFTDEAGDEGRSSRLEFNRFFVASRNAWRPL